MKLGAKSAPAPAETPTDDAPVDDAPIDDTSSEEDTNFDSDVSADDTTQDTGSSDKPFDDEPFDAGVEADEESDPKKFIEQLTGKLGQSLRKYTEEQGQPDFELEKFAVNSLLSATHTGEMDSEDQKDIISKVKKSGKGDDLAEPSDDEEVDVDVNVDDTEQPAEEPTEEPSSDDENLFETDIVGEMSLNDHMSEVLIDLYDKGDNQTREIIFKLVTLDNPFKEKDENDKELNRKKLLNDLQDDNDKDDIEYVFGKLKEMGILSDDSLNEVNLFLKNPPKNNMFQEGSNDILDEKNDRCTKIAKRKYKVWPSAYASGAVVKCRQGKIWKGVKE